MHNLSHITQQKGLSWDLATVFTSPYPCLPKLRRTLHHLWSSASRAPSIASEPEEPLGQEQ